MSGHVLYEQRFSVFMSLSTFDPFMRQICLSLCCLLSLLTTDPYVEHPYLIATQSHWQSMVVYYWCNKTFSNLLIKA